MTRYLIVLLTLLLIYIFYQTPFHLSNILIGLTCPDIKLAYKTENGNIITYQFSHYDTDAIRARHLIQESTDMRKDFALSNVESEASFKDYHKIDSRRVGNYSLFNSMVARFCKKIFEKQKWRKELVITIVLSFRSIMPENIKWSPGNRLCYLTYIVKSNNTLSEMCEIQANMIKKHRERAIKDKRFHNDIIDALRFALNTDFTFNSWRELSTIERNDGLKLEFVPFDINVTKGDMKDLYERTENAYIILNFINDSFVVSDIKYTIE